jgi:hypothetical protein
MQDQSLDDSPGRYYYPLENAPGAEARRNGRNGRKWAEARRGWAGLGISHQKTVLAAGSKQVLNRGNSTLNCFCRMQSGQISLPGVFGVLKKGDSCQLLPDIYNIHAGVVPDNPTPSLRIK